MVLEKIIKALEKLETPANPLLGPNLKGLYLFGLWLSGTKLRNSIFIVIHIFSFMFVCTQFVDLYQTRKDMLIALQNLSMTGFSTVTVSKTISFISMRSKWSHLVNLISAEEISEIKKNDPYIVRMMAKYKKYSRMVTYTFWLLVIVTNLVTISTPAMKYVSASEYREAIRNGTTAYPHILSSWFPFNKDKVPNYFAVVVFHALMTCQGAGIVAAYDATAITIMAFLKGQTMILREKCGRIFGEDESITKIEVFNRVKECHRHHNYIKRVYGVTNSLLSPVMFIYVLICSITLCCGVVQFTSDQVTVSQKMWVAEYVLAQVFQLFLYCWHSNEIALEVNIFWMKASRLTRFLMSEGVIQGLFESKYWRSDLKERKLLLLLAFKMEQPFILHAGPFTNLSIPTFTQIIKGSYSFYTLFTQMQE